MTSREEIEKKINDKYSERRLSGSPYHAYWASIVVADMLQNKDVKIEVLQNDNKLLESCVNEHEKEIQELRKLNNEHLQEIAKRGSQITELKKVLDKADVIMNNAANMCQSSILKNAILLSVSSLNLKDLLK